MSRDELRQSLQATIDASIYMVAAMVVGFSFGRIEVSDGMVGCLMVRLDFQCICGKREVFTRMITHPEFNLSNLAIDLARDLYHHGSFSKAHLLADGYSEADASAIDRRYRAFLVDGDMRWAA